MTIYFSDMKTVTTLNERKNSASEWKLNEAWVIKRL